jgi:hypothetical protein
VKAALQGRRVLLASLAAGVLSTGTLALVNPAVFAGPPKPDYSLAASSDTVTQPTGTDTAHAQFTITMVPNSTGYPDPVLLSYGGLPKGVTGVQWSDDSATVNTSPTSRSIDLMFDVPASIKVGTYTFTVTGKNATTLRDARDVKVTLGVAAPTGSGTGFSLAVSPTQRTIQQGASNDYDVQLLASASFSSSVALTAKGLPAGTSGAFSPSSVSKTTTTTSRLNLSVTPSAHAGVFHFTIEGTSGKSRYDVVVQLTIQAAPGTTGFSLALSPSQQQIAAGAQTTFALGIARTNFAAVPINLSVTGLPQDAVPSFDVNPAYGDGSTLTITTSELTTPDGNFEFTVTGTDGAPTPTTAKVKGHLVVNSPPGKTFGISGDGANFHPGGAKQSIDLVLSNPNDKPILITSLVVTIAGANQADCGASDYDLKQYTGGYPLRIEKRSSRSLSALGVPSDQWPSIQLLNQPWNQDGCKGATLTLAYSGNAREAG